MTAAVMVLVSGPTDVRMMEACCLAACREWCQCPAVVRVLYRLCPGGKADVCHKLPMYIV